jgi:uncharacterized protein YjcR
MMNEVRAPDKEQIKREYLKGVKPKELSEKYNISINTIKSWIKRYGWSKLNNKEGAPVKKKGAPFNNKNAVGNKGGAAPIGNKNAEKHGFFAKWLPEETREIMQSIQSADPLELLWDNIQLQYTAIIRAQKIMYVKDPNDKTVEKIGEKSSDTRYGEEWEVQQAWDKQATFLKAQSRAMKTLESMIRQYDEMLHKNWEMATEEQKLRMQKLKSEIKVLEDGNITDKVTIIDDIEGGENDN